MAVVGPTQGLRTTDNYLTVTYNGTTIKQLWGKIRSNTSVKYYQKWKDGVVYEDSSTGSAYGFIQAKNEQVKVNGYGQKSYCIYKFRCYVYQNSPYSTSGHIGRFRFVCNGTQMYSDVANSVSSGELLRDSTYTYATHYRSSTSEYRSQSYTGYMYYAPYLGNGSSEGQYLNSESSVSATTPSQADRSYSNTKTDSSDTVTVYGYTTIATTGREEDND